MTHRDIEIGRIRKRLQTLYSPRLQMMLIVALTGATGLLVSVLLRAQGMHLLWQRYALAVVAAYAMFLLLLRLWVHLHNRDLGDEIDLFPDGSGSSGGSTHCTGRPSSRDADGLFDDFPDIDEAGILLIAIAALAIAVGAIFWAIWIAPTLLAELVFDVALASGLYRRLRRIESSHWLSTALRRTWVPFVLVLVLIAGAGGVLQHRHPEIGSIGDVFATVSPPPSANAPEPVSG